LADLLPMLQFVVLLAALPLTAENRIQFQLPDQGAYRMTVTTKEEAKSNGKPSSRTTRLEAKVAISRQESGGHRLQIDYLAHYEQVDNQIPSADLRGVSLTYEIAADGSITRAEGLEDLIRRTNSGVQRVAPSLAPETARAQFLFLQQHCELLAAYWAGKVLDPGHEWNDTRPRFAGGLTPRPLTQNLRVVRPVPCGLGDCLEIEGTYQNNITDDARRLIHAIIDDNPPDSKLPVGGLVNSAWETGRVNYYLHPPTGLLARIALYTTSFTEVLSGSKVNREESTRSSELILDDINRARRAPLKVGIVGSLP
jgi:hypothetical protein